MRNKCRVKVSTQWDNSLSALSAADVALNGEGSGRPESDGRG